MSSETLQLAEALIARPSLTPDDAGCQALLMARLSAIGFKCETFVFGEVTNLWARRGTAAPVLTFVGHTDVVPTGPISAWSSDPFQPEIRDGYLYGRGAADMKSSIAAMVTACERFVADYPDYIGSIAFLITSDEEGPAHNGTVKVIEVLEARGEKIDWALVGEPSSHRTMGDVIKNGRRGSISGTLTVHGVQGHIAYPQLADNPIHNALPALHDLCTRVWDQGNKFFPATRFQISNIKSGTGATNIIPGQLMVCFNLRYSTELTHQSIIQITENTLSRYGLEFTIKWHHSGLPFLTSDGDLVDAVRSVIKRLTSLETELSTAGGTSDGRFVAPTGAQVIELGPVNASIHQVNECTNIVELDALSNVYQGILEQLLV